MRNLRPPALLLLAVLLVVAVLPQQASAAVTFRLVDLSVQQAGAVVHASARVSATAPRDVDQLGVCARDTDGHNYDIGRKAAATIGTAGTRSVEGERVLPPGRYGLYACLSFHGSWMRVGEPRQLTVTVQQVQASALPSGLPGRWRLTFNDEFTGTALDTRRWTPGWFGSGVTQPVNGFETQCYSSTQTQVRGDGYLTLSLVARASRCGGRTRPHTSGLVSSNGKYAFRYGATEARIHLAADKSGKVQNWPAFWTDGQNWPTDGENDVMESLGGAVGPAFHSEAVDDGFEVPGRWSGWHTYGAMWTPGRVSYYYDGRYVGSISEGITGQPMYLVLNYASGFDGHTVPAEMKVDWVRVWQR